MNIHAIDLRHAYWRVLVAFLLCAVMSQAALADRPHDGRRDGPPDRSERWSAPRQGERVRVLPRQHVVVNVDRSRYYYGGGAFYRPYGRSYVVVRAPLGARVRSLPYGYVSFMVGSGRYFFGAGNYYLWEPRVREYVVVDAPRGGEAAAKAAAPETSTQIFAYPKQGQSEAQTDRDRYDCHLWAGQQSGFDPTEPGEALGMIPDYRRAMTACLEGRGYSVQ